MITETATSEVTEMFKTVSFIHHGHYLTISLCMKQLYFLKKYGLIAEKLFNISKMLCSYNTSISNFTVDRGHSYKK